MKKIFYKGLTLTSLVLVGLFIFAPIAGAAWSSQTSGVTVNINGVSFADANNGWVVGDDNSGTEIILNTTDGGETWTAQIATVTGNVDLKDIYMYDSSNGIAVGTSDGTRGAILYTTDGGTTWTLSTDGDIANKELYGVCMASATVGWAVGQAVTTTGVNILYTIDGGVNWSAQVAGGYVAGAPDLYDVDAASTTVATIVGAPDSTTATLFHTVNAGTAWTQHTDADLPITIDMNSVCMTSATTAYVVGDDDLSNGLIFTATSLPTDSWVQQTGGTVPTYDLFAVAAINATTIWTVGETDTTNGVVLKASDSGALWDQQTSSVLNVNLLGVSAIDPDHVWAVGEATGGAGTILKYSDETAPAIILNATSSAASDSTPTFTGSATDYDSESNIASVEYRVDSGDFQSASITAGGGTPDIEFSFTTGELDNGEHDIEVRATDAADAVNVIAAENYGSQTITVAATSSSDDENDDSTSSTLIATGPKFDFSLPFFISSIVAFAIYLILNHKNYNQYLAEAPLSKLNKRRKIYMLQF